MNDRAVTLLEQYDIEVLRTRKGRGAILCETPQGTLIFKEYAGNEARLALENQVLQQLAKQGTVKVDRLLATKEGALFVKDRDGISYILKTYYEGRECNIYERNECLLAMQVLARLHQGMELEAPSQEISLRTPLQEYEKRNKELTRIRSYLRKKGQKQYFERQLESAMDLYLQQAKQVTEDWKSYEKRLGCGVRTGQCFHGDYQYHNIILFDREWYVINFEKCQYGSPITDIYLLMRKLLEKSGWSVTLGKELLEAYEQIRPISAYDRIDLYYRLAYPEKFWKIANFYFNSRKAWIPEKNMEKLNKVMEQELARQTFLEQVFSIEG
ncbi:MAG: CotS family spore coat protein [Lachnospiraceae bacterium]|nr:CotS family spore coat protein [Lachnospiraceae bacterium]